MPAILESVHMVAILALGLVGLVFTLAGVYFLAARWRSRRAVPYCLSALVLYSLLYVATFKHALINAEIEPGLTDGSLLTLIFIGQALVTAIGVSIFVLMTVGGYLAVLGPQEFPVSRIRSYVGSAFFCFLVTIVVNPLDAVRKVEDPSVRSIYQTALTAPSPEVVEAAGREAERTLSALREIGALTRIDVEDGLLVHRVRGQFLDLPNSVVKEYMRAALFHHIHFEGGKMIPVVLRVAGSNREIALLEPNGRFRRNRVTAPQIGSLPHHDLPPGS